MSQPLTQAFVTSFLTTCFDNGLTKEAAAALLQKESADQVRRARPAFAAGYDKIMNDLPGGANPMLVANGMEKAAGPKLDQVMKILRGIKGTIGGVAGLGGEVAHDVSRAGSKMIGPRNPNSFLNRHPFAAFTGGAALAGGGTYGLTKWLGRDNSLTPYGADPFLPPSGYSPELYKKRYDSALYDTYGPGIAAHNREYFGTSGRRKELEKAVAEGRGGYDAYLDLQRLNREHEEATRARESHLQGLKSTEHSNRDLLSRIRERQQDLERQRTAWWAAPKRWWTQLRGGNLFDSDISKNYFDNQIASLQDNAARSSMAADLAKDRHRLIEGGFVALRDNPPPSSRDIQKSFFPAWKE